ncbi:carbon-phosphorus lyase complex subunit PhnI [Halobacillus halophilus]|uniref:carbon-phosphorus lyase complex subunit PhnI n=1 Tax=Halobacillus halophilus TaxID=1570 RepID=UPI001CD4F5E7|nr:carbon-phosphorus lyase complex subunit PhnI [Halobacillus halophilus]MCA1011961.1 carbon-phosphorus lyase complex subunit PhnI [Halobacillus halophilus]
MGYVAVTGGQEAIEQADKLSKYYRTSEITSLLDPQMIEKQMRLLIDRIMGEGGMYAPEYAAIALKQAEGDPLEATFLMRAYRSTLPRHFYSHAVDTSSMRVIRRISASFKDIPGGQMLGPTNDYTHRLLQFSLRHENEEALQRFATDYGLVDEEEQERITFPKIVDLLREQGLVANTKKDEEVVPCDITRQKLTFPASRSARLQTLARGETGAMTSLAYSSMRGFGVIHPTVGELRVGYTEVTIPYPFGENDDDGIYLGEVMMTEVESINSFDENEDEEDLQFAIGYGLTLGQNEVKGIAMSILDRSLETTGDQVSQDEEYVLTHIDSVESYGFVSHLKLPHYITFQSKLDRIRQAQQKQSGKGAEEYAETT